MTDSEKQTLCLQVLTAFVVVWVTFDILMRLYQ